MLQDGVVLVLVTVLLNIIGSSGGNNDNIVPISQVIAVLQGLETKQESIFLPANIQNPSQTALNTKFVTFTGEGNHKETRIQCYLQGAVPYSPDEEDDLDLVFQAAGTTTFWINFYTDIFTSQVLQPYKGTLLPLTFSEGIVSWGSQKPANNNCLILQQIQSQGGLSQFVYRTEDCTVTHKHACEKSFNIEPKLNSFFEWNRKKESNLFQIFHPRGRLRNIACGRNSTPQRNRRGQELDTQTNQGSIGICNLACYFLKELNDENVN